MPIHDDGQIKDQRKGKTKEKKGRKSAVADKLPLTDSVDWRKRILEGTREDRLAAIKDAVEKKDRNAVDALIKTLGEQEADVAGEAYDAIAELTVNEEQFQTIVGFLVEGSDIKKSDAAYVLGLLKDARAVPYLIAADDDDSGVREKVAEALGRIGDKRAVPVLIKLLKDSDINVSKEAVLSLGNIGDKKAIAPFKEYLKYCVRAENDGEDYAIVALEKLGVPKHEIEKIVANPVRGIIEETLEEHLESPDQVAIYHFISKNKNTKRIVFENASILDILPNRQAWITVNEPQLAKNALQLALQKLGNRRDGLDNALASNLGVRVKQLEEEKAHFTYYADEILDTIVQVVRNSQLKNDDELSALLSGIRYGNGITLRYIKRELADLSLGDKCGDCTAKGSVNFGNSVTWLVNPAYQILKMSKDGRFIGKINFTLGTIAGKDAIIIDALEFNPQAVKGKPYHKDGKACLKIALEFLRELSEKQNRQLFALATSNSSGAVAILRSQGDDLGSLLGAKEREAKPVPLTLLIPQDDVLRTLKVSNYSGEVKFFYQMLDSLVDSRSAGGKDRMDTKLPELEREVINPMQIANADVATAMRARDFEKAAALILADSEAEEKVRGIFSLPKGAGISPKFLCLRLEKLYHTQALDAASLRRTFQVEAGNFVKL